MTENKQRILIIDSIEVNAGAKIGIRFDFPSDFTGGLREKGCHKLITFVKFSR